VAQDAGTWQLTALTHCLCRGMVDGAEIWGAPICRQSVSSLVSHIPWEHHAVGLSKYTKVTKQARWQNRRRWWSEHVVAVSSLSVFPSPACVRDRSPCDVSAEVVTWVWGIQMNADRVADGSVQVCFDAGSVLWMTFFGALEEVADAVQDTVGRAPSKET